MERWVRLRNSLAPKQTQGPRCKSRRRLPVIARSQLRSFFICTPPQCTGLDCEPWSQSIPALPFWFSALAYFIGLSFTIA